MIQGNVQDQNQIEYLNVIEYLVQPSGLVQVGIFLSIQKQFFKKIFLYNNINNSFIGWSDCTTTCGSDGIQKMKFECEPPDNEVFYDCGMEPISVRKCPNNPQCPSIGNFFQTCL